MACPIYLNAEDIWWDFGYERSYAMDWQVWYEAAEMGRAQIVPDDPRQFQVVDLQMA
jgi:hypothetical protein